MSRAIQLNKVVLIVGVTILGLLLVSAAQAAMIQHLDNNDPATEGFALSGTPAQNSADAGPPLNWKMTEAGILPDYYYPTGAYPGSGGNATFDSILADASGWTWTMSAKVANVSGAIAEQAGHATNWLQFTNGGSNVSRLVVSMFSGSANSPGAGVYVMNGNTAVAQFGTANPTTEWHTYQVYMNPNGPGTTDDTLGMYLDGVLVDTLTRADIYGQSGSLQVWWFGKVSGTSSSGLTQQYAIERLESGQHIVPEPSSLVLLAAGLIGLLCYAWRKRR